MPIELEDVPSGYNLSKINNNFQTIENYVNTSLLHRAETAVAGEAKMERDLDMDSHNILNGYVGDIPLSEIAEQTQNVTMALKDGGFGWVTLDSFQDGNTIEFWNQVLRWKLPDGDGEFYRWDGPLPKVVPVGSTPATSGGIGPGKWLSVGDASLRAALGSDGGVLLVKGASILVNTVADLQVANWLVEGLIVTTSGYYSKEDGGGNRYQIINKGVLVHDGGSLISLTNPLLIAKATFTTSVKFRQFGGIGDKIVDDTARFIAATAFCKTNKINLDISDMKVALRTLASPINIDDYWVIGNGVPTALPTLYYDYLIGGDKAEEVWLLDSNFVGSGIYCPTNTVVFTGKSFQIQDVCMYGNYNQTSNKAFSQTTVTTYPGWSRALQGTRVTIHYFGSYGIELKGGLEVCNISHVKIAFCRNNCLLVDMTAGINCPIEYLDFDSTCYFMYSKVNNVLLNGFRKHVSFDNILLNGAGQYDVVKQQNPAFTIATPGAALASVSVVGLAAGNYGGITHNSSYAFRMERCYAEACHNLLTTSGAFINDITLTESTTFPVDASWARSHLIVYNDTSYIKTFGNKLPDGKFYYYLDVPVISSLVSAEFGEEVLSATVSLGAVLDENKRVVPNIAYRFRLGNGLGGDARFNLNTAFPTFANAANTQAKMMVFSVTATHQLATLDAMGAYLVYATKMPSGNWIGVVQSSGTTTGFAFPPAISTNGDFAMSLTAGYRVSVTRIDNQAIV